MRLTRAGEYAIRCMLYLTLRGQGKLVAKQEIATQAVIPAHFLTKIAQDLARANLIQIKQGPKGGFILLKDPEQVTLLEVIEVMIGRISLNDCVGNPESCPASRLCSINRIWGKANSQLRETLAGVTLAELGREKSCIPTFPVLEQIG